jgi:hypothetical protein
VRLGGPAWGGGLEFSTLGKGAGSVVDSEEGMFGGEVDSNQFAAV